MAFEYPNIYLANFRLTEYKVGRAPAALNFAADTGWDIDWLRLERVWTQKCRMLSSENGNKKHSINHYTHTTFIHQKPVVKRD